MKLLPTELRNNHRCYFCGSSPVKYSRTVFDPLECGCTSVCVCNKCALLYSKSEHIDEQGYDTRLGEDKDANYDFWRNSNV